MADPNEQPMGADPSAGGSRRGDASAPSPAAQGETSGVEPSGGGPESPGGIEQNAPLGQHDLDALIDAAGSGDDSAFPKGVDADDGERGDERAGSPMRETNEGTAQASASWESSDEDGAASYEPSSEAYHFSDLSDGAERQTHHRITMLSDVDLNVRIQLGQTRMLVEDVLKLDAGSVVELDKLAGDPVDVYVNDRLVARGEVLVLNDNFCVRISDVLSRDPHRVVM